MNLADGWGTLQRNYVLNHHFSISGVAWCEQGTGLHLATVVISKTPKNAEICAPKLRKKMRTRKTAPSLHKAERKISEQKAVSDALPRY